jgi:8-amino-7-oxononanoate synthase
VRVYPHADVAALRAMLVEHASSPRRLIVSDTVFSMDGDFAPLRELAALASETGSMLMVDEAHATGVLGANGGGLVELLGLAGQVPVVMGTLSKSLGSLGGYVAGETRLIDYLRNCARSFVFTTALPPASAAAALAALDIIECEPQRRAHVLALTARLAASLRAAGFDVLPAEAAIIAVIIGPSDAALALAAGLREQGIFAPAIRPPTVPSGTARIRLAITAAHTEAHIERALAAFVAAKAVAA